MADFFLAVAVAMLALASGCAGHPLESIINGNGTKSAQELLESHGFPPGLLPNNVQSYTLDNGSGKFKLELSGRCDVTIPGEYPVEYRAEIKGSLSYGSIDDLSGVWVKVVFVWFELSGIYMDGDKVVFQVGLLSASYPATNFDESPPCGGGSSSSTSLLDRSY